MCVHACQERIYIDKSSHISGKKDHEQQDSSVIKQSNIVFK